MKPGSLTWRVLDALKRGPMQTPLIAANLREEPRRIYRALSRLRAANRVRRIGDVIVPDVTRGNPRAVWQRLEPSLPLLQKAGVASGDMKLELRREAE